MAQYLLRSIQAGVPEERVYARTHDGGPERWTSGIYKQAVSGPVHLGQLNLDGDGQADLRFHGGADRAVLAYTADAYGFWRAQLNLPDLPHGAFGENFTIAGLNEDTVCLGDVYQVGDAVVQVSQPRVPCWKLARRIGIPDLAARVLTTGRTGWYYRVLHEGTVEAGMSLTLIDRPYPDLTIAQAHAIWRSRRSNPVAAANLAACPALSTLWRGELLGADV